jgi:hypothetical protein
MSNHDENAFSQADSDLLRTRLLKRRAIDEELLNLRTGGFEDGKGDN